MPYFVKTNFGSLQAYVAAGGHLAWSAELSDDMVW